MATRGPRRLPPQVVKQVAKPKKTIEKPQRAVEQKKATTGTKKTTTQAEKIVQAKQVICHDNAAIRMMTPAIRAKLTGRMLFGKETLGAMQKRLVTACAALSPDLFTLMLKAICSFSPGDGANADIISAGHALLDENTQRVYSPGKPLVYGAFQDCDYHKPCGWVRWNVAGIPENAPCFKWSVGYHGTQPQHLMKVVDKGLLSPADRQTVALHGQVGATAETENKVIYTSPCVGYSAHPVYTPLIKTSGAKAAQILLQVRVNQNAVVKRLKTTLPERCWPDDVPFEPGFATDDDMEWLVVNKDELVVTGILFREIGCKTDEDRARYGEVACSFTARGDAPEYKWTKHLSSSIKVGCEQD